MAKASRVGFLVMVLWSVGTAAGAEQPVRRGLDPDAPSYFSKGTWTLELAGGYVKDWDRGKSSIALGDVGLGYYIDNTLSLRVEVVGYSFNQEPDDAWGGAVNFLGRHHVLNRGDVSFFIDGGVGVVETSRRVPDGGTHLNFTPQVGMGMTWRLREKLHLIGGVRYFHLSNARIEGHDRNPQINGVEAHVGLMWQL